MLPFIYGDENIVINRYFKKGTVMKKSQEMDLHSYRTQGAENGEVRALPLLFMSHVQHVVPVLCHPEALK